MKEPEIVVNLPDGNKLMIELYNYDGDHPEICAFIKDKDGCVVQDICMLRPSEKDRNKVECLVWADERNEDYTHKFTIKQCDWSEEYE